MKKINLEITVFVCGGIVMILELVGSRILAPYAGTSIFVWTNLIGVIMASLSFGYWQGGRLADKNPNRKTLSLIILQAAVFTGLIAIFNVPVLEYLNKLLAHDIKIKSLLSALILFAPASAVLGMVSPYAVRLKMKELKESGKTVGNLYAISTIGSIVGTFLAGFVLMAYMSNTQIILLLSIALSILYFFIHFRFSAKEIIFLSLFLTTCFFSANISKAKLEDEGILEFNTPYNNVRIADIKDNFGHRQIREMSIGASHSSAMFLNDPAGDNLVFSYTKFYDLADYFSPKIKTTLMLGGAAYSYPKYFLRKNISAEMDVVEIDPGLTELAKKYFYLKDDPRLNIYHEDARIFLNESEKKYDVIFGDVFNSTVIPFHVATVETAQEMKKSLNENGVVLINIISSLNGDFLKAEYKTFKSVFPQVFIFAVNSKDKNKVQNIILAALNDNREFSFESADEKIADFLKNLWTEKIPEDLPPLTDDFAPVDYYLTEVLR